MLYPLTMQSYESRSLPFSAQRLVNVYPESGTNGSKSQLLLIGTPGLVEEYNVGVGPIRGMIESGEYIYAVSGLDVYRLDKLGGSAKIGSIGGTDMVSMAQNGTQVVIVSENKAFIIESGAVSQITLPSNFSNPKTVTYIDGYFIYNNETIAFNSALGDGNTYDPLDFSEAGYDPDGLVAVYSYRNFLYLFGPNTIERWYNFGGTNFPYAPDRGATQEVGIKAKASIANIDNTMMFLGNDQRGITTVWKFNGGQFVPVSTPAIDKKLEEFDDIANATAFAYTQEGHSFYVLNLPNFITLVYDVTTGVWHERETYGINDWRVRSFVYFNGKHLVGDSVSGKVFRMDLDVYDEADRILRREVNTAVIATENNQWGIHDFVRMDFDSGVGLTTGQGDDPLAGLSWADEDGQEFNNIKYRGLGKKGERRKRVFWRRLGKSRSRVYKLEMSDPVQCLIKGLYVNIRPGMY